MNEGKALFNHRELPNPSPCHIQCESVMPMITQKANIQNNLFLMIRRRS